MKNRFSYWILMIFFLTGQLYGQPNCHVEHYDLIDGLPQRTVMCMIQDQKGFMWFGTWDGICKFDGYNFTSYKTSASDTIQMKNNRINQIVEDKHGFIWVQAYNKEIFCFDPRIEKYITTFTVNNSPFYTDKILPMASGKVWLTSYTMGAICVTDSLRQYKIFDTDRTEMKSNCVHMVHEDSRGHNWLLTRAGLLRFNPDTDTLEIFFNGTTNGEEEARPFFSCFETEDEIWFGSDQGRIYCYQKKEDRFLPFTSNTGSDIISIYKILDNRFIILTRSDGFFITNHDRTLINYYNKNNIPQLSGNHLYSCYIDSDKNIWLETDGYEVLRYDFLENKFKSYSAAWSDRSDLQTPPVYQILEDSTGQIWVQPRGGGFSYYDKEKDRLVPFYNNPSSPERKFSHMLHACLMDRQGNLWISTRSEGLEKIVFDKGVFTVYQPEQPYSEQSDKEVRALFQDTYNRHWIGSKDELIRIYSADKNYEGYLCANGAINKTGNPLKGSAYCFLQDSRENIWIGTKGNGIYLLQSGPHNKSYHITNYIHDPADVFSLSDDNVYSIHEDPAGNIWIGSHGGGLNLWDAENERFINYRNNLITYPMQTGHQIRHINSDSQNNVYIGTTLGLIVFKTGFSNPGKIEYKIYNNNTSGSKAKLLVNNILNICITTTGETYLSIYGGGLYKVVSCDAEGYPASFISYDTKDGLPSDVALSAIEDHEGMLWIATEAHLSKFNPETETIETYSDVVRLMDRNYISEATPLRTHTGAILFGSLNGLLSFHPSNITLNDYKPYLALTHFRVANKELQTHHRIDDIHELKLTYKENFFSIEYAALDYTAPFNIQYAYCLEGIDSDWVYNFKQRTVNYSNVPPGRYLFKVRSTNSNGNWVDNEHLLHIYIRPSFWQTGWAYGLYIVLFLLIMTGILYSIILFYRMRDKMVLEQQQTELKTRFFTDISHEIRTPLTMIVSPVENILEDEHTHPNLKPQLQLILKNANRMLSMVNQILDFRKIQKQKLKVQEVAIGEYTTDICNTFFKTADEKGINLEITNQVGSETIWLDCHNFEKLVFNLISNAIKYTPLGNLIEVSVFRKDKTIAFQVKDEGKGISKETLNKLFTRFVSFNTDKSKPSTGIGLSIVKEVADKHHARITVDSEINKGSVFTVYFPIGVEIYENDPQVEILQNDKKITETYKEEDLSGHETEHQEQAGEHLLTVLIVEDDIDLRSFVRTLLETEYHILEAANGKEGYEMAMENLPDFILSDIMMPEMDGMELLQKLRSNRNTSHIPFILLTAKTNIDDKLEGIDLGADDYITKPFNVKLLKAKISGIIRQRKRYYTYLRGDAPLPYTDQEPVKEEVKILPEDEKFLREIQEEVERNIDNNEYLVEELVATTVFSRKVFFKKMKSLTGLAPVEFIREVRIQKAAQLLESGSYYVKEVAYMVGFSDIKYFSKCFKKTYGMTPVQYKDMNTKS